MSQFVTAQKLCNRDLAWSLRCWYSPSPSPLPPGARDSWRQGGADVTTFDYDFNGNLTNKTDGLNTPTPTTTALAYDPLDQMVTASKSWEQPQSYQYDDQGRRISKSVGGKVINYVYNGQDIVAEYTGTWNQAAASYTHGVGTDQPLIRTTGAATPISQYYHQDGLGSVTAVTDQTGATVGTARNDAWGNKLSGNGGLPQYGYTGREPDETGLVFYRGRYYDPTIGRFIQRDPIGMEGGMNLYAYVGNNPINFTDPMGTLPQLATSEASPFNTRALGTTSANPSLANLYAANGDPNTVCDFGCGVGIAADVGVGFTPAGVVADIYGAVKGKTLFGGQALSWWERGLGIIPFVSETIQILRGGIKGADEFTSLYAVVPGELSDIAKSGVFRNPFGIENKYFSTTAEGAASYAQQANKAFGMVLSQ